MFSFRTSPASQRLSTLIMGGSAVLLVLCIIAYPDKSFQASLQGLKVWWTIIFPALLPFLILSEMLKAYGWVHGIGVLLDPLMRTLFRLPGIGGWAWSVGWTAGYPAGAEAVVRLRKDNELSRLEAERLLGLTHAASPIFMIAVVGVGFLQQAELGLVIAVVHWVSSLLMMLIVRWAGAFHPAADRIPMRRTASAAPKPLWKRMLQAMEQAHRRDGRAFGRLLGDAVTSSVQTLMMIGGYIMMFSVIVQVLRLAIPQEFGAYLLNGLLEVNLGAYSLGSAAFRSPLIQTALIGAVIAWSGISAHLQVHSLTRGTDLRYSRFLLMRLLHAGSAFLLTFVLWHPLHRLLRLAPPEQAAFRLLDVENGLMQEPSSWIQSIAELASAPGWLQSLALVPVLCILLLIGMAASLLIGSWKRV
ncbi:nucleoside recognition domain-containing protein [Paenibacillus dendritiformis]|uniref:nucleoside recognition domain-containing protein n=1 Tax=Paenibacillus dendritiformis TaxID=130049 RepID=UPI0018CE6B2D|nr:nucleoside recognition domain-containing protein [Paenibacillus dendritiformis]MBG9793415.1 nucleoside recognition domain-containing protein [Paenibacillus dendritiformis]